MATPEAVRKLAALARIRVADADIGRFTREFDAILGYIGQLETLDVPLEDAARPPMRNVTREDGEPHAARAYTEALVEQFPAREGDALVVKQVISHE